MVRGRPRKHRRLTNLFQNPVVNTVNMDNVQYSLSSQDDPEILRSSSIVPKTTKLEEREHLFCETTPKSGDIISGWIITDSDHTAQGAGVRKLMLKARCSKCGKLVHRRVFELERHPCRCEEREEKQHEKRRRKRMARPRKPGYLVKYANMPTEKREMLADLLGPTFMAIESVAKDRFLVLLDAYQGDDVQIPTVQEIEKRMILAITASEYMHSDGSDQAVELIAQRHHTNADTIRRILHLAAIELKNAGSEYAFRME